jgi:arylsulfatase A-like enzyme
MTLLYLHRWTSYARTPVYRGFDKWYGYYSGFIGYSTKRSSEKFIDLQNGVELETDESLLAATSHSAYIFAEKANQMVTDHYNTYGKSQPFFLYYASQLVHFPYEVPRSYSSRCAASGATSNYINYCGMLLMFDEAIANISCTLSSTGLLDNTIIILASDNGANTAFPGGSYPYRGSKWYQYRGGISASAFIFSPLLAGAQKGTSFSGLMHVTGMNQMLLCIANCQ